MRWNGSAGSDRSAYGLRAIMRWSRNNTKPLPRRSFVPDRVTTFTTPPEACPYSALKPVTSTWTSCTESSARACRE